MLDKCVCYHYLSCVCAFLLPLLIMLTDLEARLHERLSDVLRVILRHKPNSARDLYQAMLITVMYENHVTISVRHLINQTLPPVAVLLTTLSYVFVIKQHICGQNFTKTYVGMSTPGLTLFASQPSHVMYIVHSPGDGMSPPHQSDAASHFSFKDKGFRLVKPSRRRSSATNQTICSCKCILGLHNANFISNTIDITTYHTA